MAKLSNKLGGVDGLASAAQGVKADTALQVETNDLSSAVTWASIPDANVPASAVTQHQGSLSLTESQISDLQTYLTSVSFSDLTTTPTTIAGYGITDASTTTEMNSAISSAVSDLINAAPAALDTLDELAAAMGDDANFATTMTNALAGKVDDSQVLTDVPAGALFTDTNTTYTAGGDYGMTLSGTEFRLEDDRRRNSTTTDIYSGNTHDYTFYDADVGIRWYTANAEEMRLENDGDLHVDGNIVAYSTTVSDINLKEDVKPITGALDKIEQLGGYTFTYKKDGKESAGVIAQEVEKVLPSAVSEVYGVFHGKEDETHKVVQYDQLHGLLIEAIKELKAEIAELKGK